MTSRRALCLFAPSIALLLLLAVWHGPTDPRTAEGAAKVLPIPDDGVLREPGRYRLTSDLVTDRRIGVDIQADGIDLDLGGFAIRRDAPAAPDTFGIMVNRRSDVTVRNGSVDGFWHGVHVLSSRDVSATALTLPTIAYVGILVSDSTDVTVARNRFEGFRYDIERETDPYIVGVNIGADGFVVKDNRFRVDNTGEDFDPGHVETVAILCSAEGAVRGEIHDNVLLATRPLPFSYAVWVGNRASVTVRDNVMRNFQFGVTFDRKTRAEVIGNRIEMDSEPSFPCIGIYFADDGAVHVSGNRIRGTHHGIVLAGGVAGTVTGNRIWTADAGLPSTAGETVGIHVLEPTGVRVEQNRIRGASRPTRGPSDAFGVNDTE